MTLNQRNRITRAINKYVRAFDADSWKGGGDPADIPAIEARLRQAKKQLKRAMDDATVMPPSLEQYHGN